MEGASHRKAGDAVWRRQPKIAWFLESLKWKGHIIGVFQLKLTESPLYSQILQLIINFLVHII